MEKESLLRARKIPATAPFHLPPAAQPLNAHITLTLENAPSQPEVVLRDRRRSDLKWRIEMSPEGNHYVAHLQLPAAPTVVLYHFEFAGGGGLREKIQVEMRHIDGRNTPVFDEYSERDFQIGVYDPAGMPAEWTHGMVMYQIFPDSFARGRAEIVRPRTGTYGNAVKMKAWDEPCEIPPRGRDFYGGDIRGVIEKLDYLTDLGVDCIYFTPVFESPTNHRYDAIDYLKIDPMFGTEADFVELVEKAHTRDMKVVLDAVFNHCSVDSIYFDGQRRHGGAAQTKQSPYYRWFNFYDYPKTFQCWAGVDHMPEFVECPEVEEFFLGEKGVTTYWLARGIDGWRTDVTGCNSDEFWRAFRARINTVRPDAYTVSEEWQDATHYLVGDMYSATMNYRFTWALEGFFARDRISAEQFEDRLETLRRDTPAPALLSQMNLMASHDTRRLLSVCGEDKQRLKQIVAFQMAYPGAPMIYYGDEAGLSGGLKHPEEGRKSFPWGKEDSEILTFYRQVLATRRQLGAVMRQGAYETLLVQENPRVVAFVRRLEGKSVYCLFNAGDQTAQVEMPVREDGNYADALGLNPAVSAPQGELVVTLPARSMAWYTRT